MNLGLSRDEFAMKYYEKSFLLVRGGVKNPNINWASFDDILYASDPSSGSIQIFLHGRVPGDVYTETFNDVGRVRRRVVVPVVEDLLRQGATLVLNHVESRSRLVNDIVRQVSAFVGERATANAYVAFGGEGTFGRHWDTHDVFAIQLIGRKRWLVFEPTFSMPLAGQSSATRKHECPSVPVLDVCLCPGDVLYIPRGWWHHALPLEDDESAHIAVGIHPAHLIDYVGWCCGQLFPDEVSLRTSLRGGAISTDLADMAAQALNRAVRTPENFNRFKAWFRERQRVCDVSNLSSVRNDSEILEREGQVVLNAEFEPEWINGEMHVNGVRLLADEVSSKFISALSAEPARDIKSIIASMPREYRGRVASLLCNLVRQGVCSIRNAN